MNNVPVAIFHLKRAQFALKKALAFCGLVSILLTSACGKTPDGSKDVSLPDLPEIELGDDGTAVQVEVEKIPQIKLQPTVTPRPEPVPVVKPEPVAVKPKPESVLVPESKQQPATKPSTPTTVSTTPSVTPSNGDSGTSTANTTPVEKVEKSTAEDIRAALEKLNANYAWAMMPTYVDSYKDLTGQVREHFKVSPGKSKELKQLLAKMRDDLISRDDPDEKLQFELKEQGACEGSDEKKQASTKSCDTKAPICLSLENIKSTTAKEDLESSLRSLVMGEFARQHCADEAMAQQVVNYYSLPAIKYFRFTNSVAAIFNRVRLNLVYLQSQLTTGMTPNAGAYAQKIDSKEEICQMITQGAAQSEILAKQVIQSGFVQDPKSPVKAPRLALTETLQGMRTACDGTTIDRASLLPQLEQAIKLYDHLAQEFSKNSRMIVMDFSKHLWPHGNVDGAE